jgi:PadR family transcriptional regulator AphA
MSGYELHKHMADSVQHFWPADQAQIYRTLAQLVDEGLVTVKEIPQTGRPNRREHTILGAGLAELDTWLAASSAYEPEREAFLLRLFFVARLGPEVAKRLLRERAQEADELLEVFAAIEASAELAAAERGLTNDLHFRLRMATLANGVTHARAEREWIDHTITTLEEHRD